MTIFAQLQTVHVLSSCRLQ